MPGFLLGLELSRRFYHEAVRPILDRNFPGLPYAAARIGSGSEVLGFDSEISTDHDWGPSLQLFLAESDVTLMAEISALLSRYLPHVFHGYPVDFSQGSAIIQASPSSPVNHRVVPTSVRSFWQAYLAYDIHQPLDAADWLTFPSQKLRALTAGAVFYDGADELTAMRARFAWYPHDVWLYLLACGWQRIAQEEHLMPRAGYAGDEIGSALIGSRLVRDCMRLCLLYEKQYAPYPKWFGTAFQQLAVARDLAPIFERVQHATTWQEREVALCEAYEYLARYHNTLGITEPIPEHVTQFHTRPFKVIQAESIKDAILAQINDSGVQQIIRNRPIGSIDQWSDNTDLLEDSSKRHLFKQLYIP